MMQLWVLGDEGFEPKEPKTVRRCRSRLSPPGSHRPADLLKSAGIEEVVDEQLVQPLRQGSTISVHEFDTSDFGAGRAAVDGREQLLSSLRIPSARTGRRSSTRPLSAAWSLSNGSCSSIHGLLAWGSPTVSATVSTQSSIARARSSKKAVKNCRLSRSLWLWTLTQPSPFGSGRTPYTVLLVTVPLSLQRS